MSLSVYCGNFDSIQQNLIKGKSIVGFGSSNCYTLPFERWVDCKTIVEVNKGSETFHLSVVILNFALLYGVVAVWKLPSTQFWITLENSGPLQFCITHISR